MKILKNFFINKANDISGLTNNLLPNFKYFLDPIKTDVIIKSKATCAVCGKKKGYIYNGTFYSTNDVENICPWCIADGKAANKFGGVFQEWELEYKNIDSNKVDEFMMKTPSFEHMNPGIWPCHCNEICMFVDYAGWEEIVERKLEKELEDDLRAIRDLLECANEEIGNLKKCNSSISGYLFKCPTCGKHRLAFDLD